MLAVAPILGDDGYPVDQLTNCVAPLTPDNWGNVGFSLTSTAPNLDHRVGPPLRSESHMPRTLITTPSSSGTRECTLFHCSA